MNLIYGLGAVVVFLFGFFVGIGAAIGWFKPRHSRCRLCARNHDEYEHEYVAEWDRP